MGVTTTQLVARFPRLYHMAEDGSWPSIDRHGLLSTTALLDLFEVQGKRRAELESARRPECMTVVHPKWGTAVIRDNKPMDDDGLIRALQGGLTPRDWYEILNRKVFFWLTEARLKRLLEAGPYCALRHTVLTVDTAALLERHADRVVLSPMNSGCTKPMPHPRGPDTFLPMADYPYDHWFRKRRGNDPVVELAVDYSVPDIRDFVLRVENRGGGKKVTTIWERPS